MIQTENATVYLGSNLNVLPTLADNSIDSIVTDPPYELGFMGKSWDNSGIAYSVELWTECMRVLKPGGHLLAFGGSRTWHRLAVAIEDAGFEMRDSIAWLYGSGFPKSMDIAKSIEAKLTTGSANKTAFKNLNGLQIERGNWGMNSSGMVQDYRPSNYDETAGPTRLGNLEPTTDEAKQWQGWGTALKPAFEPVVVARKPLGEKTVAANVLKFGTGGLNIDGSRIGTEEVTINTFDNGAKPFGGAVGEPYTSKQVTGRWPANIILDAYTAELLDEQSGISTSRAGLMSNPNFKGFLGTNSTDRSSARLQGHSDSGGASRFFYVAKASKKDRNEGLDDLDAVRHSDRDKADGVGGDNPRNRTNEAKQNFHPTVKPTALMEYLIKLVTPPNGTVLDPFTGSGSTGKAAILSGFKFVGIELTEEYLPIIEGRLKWAEEQIKEQDKDERLF